MHALEHHLLGFFHTTQEHLLHRLSIPRGLRHDSRRVEYRQLIHPKHISAIHTLPSYHARLRHFRFDCGGACEKESV